MSTTARSTSLLPSSRTGASAPPSSKYKVIAPKSVWDKDFHNYFQNIQQGVHSQVGRYMQQALQSSTNPATLTKVQLLSLLMNTRSPCKFAESAVSGDGSDWTASELFILGNISMAFPQVTVYDNGRHQQPLVYYPNTSHRATLVFVSGALLNNMRGFVPCDYPKVTNAEGLLDQFLFDDFYATRLLPILRYVNSKSRKSLVTIPGIGCGQFAGPFRGQLGSCLHSCFQSLLSRHASSLPNIHCVYFDPFNECSNQRMLYHKTHYLVRPLTQNNGAKSQLSLPRMFQDSSKDDFSDCDLFSLVAWDPVSYPGNDFYVGSRMTDDGVKAAATNSMWMVTKVEGRYDDQVFQYNPPSEYETWEDVVMKHRVKIYCESDNLLVL